MLHGAESFGFPIALRRGSHVHYRIEDIEMLHGTESFGFPSAPRRGSHVHYRTMDAR
jgi:predicted RNA binding protein YcfA (HicA-like mRNA interferase family)